MGQERGHGATADTSWLENRELQDLPVVVKGCQGWGSGRNSGVRAGPEDQQVQATTGSAVSLGAGNPDPHTETHAQKSLLRTQAAKEGP